MRRKYIDAGALAFEIQRLLHYYESHYDQTRIGDLVASAATSRPQRGFALIAALFLLVVLTALGTYVQTGIQYAAARVLTTGNCTGLPVAPAVALNLPQGFDVRLSCNNNETLVANAPTVTVFLATATATRGQYGSPEFVSRQRTVRITTP